MKKLLKIILIIVLVCVLAVVGLFGVLTIFEYRPAETETAETSEGATETVSTGDELTVMTWNIGYGALGDNADFFMDGGDHVMTADTERVNENMENILSTINDVSPDIAFLQEVDKNSMRSRSVNEVELIRDGFMSTDTSFAYNFKVLFIPYPVPPMGWVNSGIMTTSKYTIDEATRYRLPCPFSWPVSVANLKRCIVVNRIALEDSDSELVVVNLHLEAYDDGEGKAAQTKLLLEILNQEADKGNYVIAGGDFNQAFPNTDSSKYPMYDGMWQPGVLNAEDFEGWQLVTDDTYPTCRSLDQPYADADKENFQYYVIDGFIVSDNLEVESVETQNLDFVSSDHNPIVMKVSFGN
ncbi:MAG: endonuclease/exonuclease/phosphatase family protein [Eubacterium sp.]|nr:endonuclease/exonuclease/phosphatase family protein [Eubacterium sp.]